MGSVRPARRFDALRALAGSSLPDRLSPGPRPPLRFRSSAEVHRSTPAPSRSPKARSSDDASSPGLSCPTTHAERRTRYRGASSPAACRVRGLRPPSRRPPPSLPRLAARSVHGLHPSRLSPRSGRLLLRGALPSWRSPRRFASLPWGACGRGRLQGLDPVSSSFCRSGSRGTRRADAFLGFLPSELSSPAGRGRFVFAARALRTRWVGSTSRPACVSRCFRADDPADPLGPSCSRGIRHR